MNNLNKIKTCLRQAKTVLISGHYNPDGDSIGSMLALGLGLRSMGKRVYMVSADPLPKRYRTLPGASGVISSCKKNVDAAIAVDCGTKTILGDTYKAFLRAKKIIEIDHHQFRKPFGDMRYVDFRAAAVGELVYRVLTALKVGINPNIAKCLLTSIIVETNSFRLPSTTANTFWLCSRLMRENIDFHAITEIVYWSKTRASLLLSGICLSKVVFLKQARLAYTVVRIEDFKKTKAGDEDVDALANDILSIDSVSIAIFFREKNKKTLRVSLRSKGAINVAMVAEGFGGGGHFDSAGCFIENSPQAMNSLLEAAKKII